MSENEIGEETSDHSDYNSENEAAAHSAAIKRLKLKDPDFYEFLQANDKDLLNFEDSDENLSEDEEEEETPAIKPLNASKLKFIQSEIKNNPSIKICKELISAFKHSVQQADGSTGKIDMSNSELFNDVMKLCLIELVPAFAHILKLPSDTKKIPTNLKSWKRVQSMIKSYLIYLLKLFSIMKETTALVLLLKHAIHLIPYFSKFGRLSSVLLKKMVSFWSGEEETVRVLSMIVIVRTVKSLPEEHFSKFLKSMYFAYVKNTKFTSVISWPMINFMKRSLTEVYSIYPEIAYQHAFVYIRQLSIHLRNAMTVKKKDTFQTVYNWQYVHCLIFWSHLLCRFHHHEAIKNLIYPLVQTVIGTVNLIPTAKFVPLRFHLIKLLMHISRETGYFIPVLPFILDTLTLFDYNKKSAFSVRGLNFECSLKVTKSQLLEAAFKEKCISEVCRSLIDYLKIYAHSIGFPELALPGVLQIKSFIKQCKVQKYNQQLKSCLSKIEENTSFILDKRQSVTFNITDTEEIKRWEQNILELKTPLLKFEIPEEVVNSSSNKKRVK